MTSISGGSTLTQHLYMKLFDRLDSDGDGALSAKEVESSGIRAENSAKVLNTLDTNGDGRVVRSEMMPARSFGTDTLGALITTQSGADTTQSDTEILADLFKRADLDGDGALSAEEMNAERDLRLATNLDRGYMPDTILVPRDENGDGLLTKDEIGVGRMLQLPITALRFFDEMPDDQQQQFQAHRERMGLPPLEPLSESDKAAARERWAAVQAERSSGPPGTVRFLRGEIDSLRESAMAAYGAGAKLSDGLSQRLLTHILSDAWAADNGSEP